MRSRERLLIAQDQCLVNRETADVVLNGHPLTKVIDEVRTSATWKTEKWESIWLNGESIEPPGWL
jgi:hypothetical protein